MLDTGDVRSAKRKTVESLREAVSIDFAHLLETAGAVRVF
jgi:hypothetical protein